MELRWADPDERQKQSERQLELWQTEKHQQAWKEGMKRKPTAPELKLFYLLNENNYPYVYIGDGGLWIGGKNPDFIWPERRLIVECFGAYWHDEDEIEPRTKHFANYDFETLIIWDYELDDTEQLLIRLEDSIKA